MYTAGHRFDNVRPPARWGSASSTAPTRPNSPPRRSAAVPSTPAADFKLAAEAQRIKLAGLPDVMLVVTTSEVQPLPAPDPCRLRRVPPAHARPYLLADDPGDGKTIMAGLYIKELLLRDDVRRCLVVAQGGSSVSIRQNQRPMIRSSSSITTGRERIGREQHSRHR